MTKLTISAIAALMLAGGPALAQPAPAPVVAPAAAAPAAPKAKLSADSKVSVLLADAKAKAVLVKHVPKVVEAAGQYPQVVEMTLKELSSIEMAQTEGGLTAEVFKKIETDLAALQPASTPN